MIVRIGRRGTSFKGASLYYLHDKRQPGEVVRLTSERVAWTESVNLANSDPEHAWREMWRTAADQKALKREAGLRTSGNAVRAPVLPIVLSWEKSDKPSPEHQREAAHALLERMGWDKHQALLVAHNDTEHQHVHILLNRVNPENGLALTESFSHRHAQAWALRYQREHGQHWCPQREINAQARAKGERTEDRHQPYPIAKDAKDAHRKAHEAEHAMAADNRSEKELLAQHHQNEREAFLADGAKQIRTVRVDVFLQARAEFKPLWRAQHAAERASAVDPDRQQELNDQRKALWKHVRTVTKERQNVAVKEFIASRREQFREIKHRQRDERAELRELTTARDAGSPFDAKRLQELTGERFTSAPGIGAVQRTPHANENQQGDAADRARAIAAKQAALSRSQSMPHIQMAAMREMKDRARRDRSPLEITDKIAQRVQQMRMEDEQRRSRDRDGHGRERVDRGRER